MSLNRSPLPGDHRGLVSRFREADSHRLSSYALPALTNLPRSRRTITGTFVYCELNVALPLLNTQTDTGMRLPFSRFFKVGVLSSELPDVLAVRRRCHSSLAHKAISKSG